MSVVLLNNSDNTPQLPKVKAPNMFNGNQKELKAFLTQARLYIVFNERKFPIDQYKVL